MKVFKKRAIAFFIDSCLICTIYTLIKLKIPGIILTDSDLALVIIISGLLLKDFFFRNASIGKKLLGLSIYNVYWNKPSFKVLLKRAVLMNFVGYFKVQWNATVRGGDLFELFEWEKNVVGTFVIDKKVYAKLKADAENMDGKFADNMTELYMMYLRDFYAKR